ncbi:hypothetical protein BH20ACI2_BH20ACI2_19020 [soil metagenome]
MLRKILKSTALVAAVVLVVLQFFGLNRKPPPITETGTLEAAVHVPADISLLMGRSCNDCHSHKTVYPWYAYVQPFGWFLHDHIEQGRENLNFSIFNTYSPEKKAKKLEEICEEVEAGSMPLPSYLWIHRDAALSASEKKALCDWTSEEAAKIHR